MKKLLIIAYVFPPIPYAGTYRTLRLCRGLDGMGTETHVVTIRTYKDIPNDFDLLSTVPQNITVHRTPIVDPWRRYQAVKAKYQSVKGFRYLNKIITSILWFFTVPDHMIFWVPFAFFKAYGIIRKYGVETVYISSPPDSSHLVGILLKKFFQIRLVADLRDPIVGNIAEVNLIKPQDLRSKILKNIKNRLEKMVIRSSDKVIVNTETHRRELSRIFPSEKFITIRNSYDRQDYEDINSTKFDIFTIAHVGSIYGLRRPDVLFDAIKRLVQDQAPVHPNIQILFVGLNSDYLAEAAKKAGIESMVKISPMVSHREAIEIMVRSHILLLIKATGEGSLGQIPGKFFEYMGTGNSILCLGPRQSEVADIIQSLQLGITAEDDPDEVYTFIKKEYEAYKEGKVRTTSSDIAQYSSERMAKKILDAIFS
jgi:glycosyltransferase involved in cell wall biosynthesis